MKKVLLLAFFALAQQGIAQQYLTREATLSFDAGSSLEDIYAISESASAVYDAQSGKLGVQVLMTSFQFKRALMQEHFNENYMYSSKFPKSTFEGVIQNFNYDKLENNYTNFIIEGEIEIKGVKKNISTVAIIKKTVEGIDLNTNFNIKLSDYDIKIPRLVFKKIDENVKVSLNYSYEKK